MRAAGVPLSKIAEALEVNLSTVKMFLKRSADDPDRQAKILLADKPLPKIAPLELTKREQKPLLTMMLMVERRRARTMIQAMGAIREFHGLTELEMETPRFKLIAMKMQAGIETLKALKGSGATLDMEASMKPAQSTPESERKEAVRARLNELATRNT
jgi:hypothetical protein